MSNTPPPINPSGESPIKTPPPIKSSGETPTKTPPVSAKPNSSNVRPNSAPSIRPNVSKTKPSMSNNIRPTTSTIKPTENLMPSKADKPKVEPIKVDANSPQVVKTAQDENKKSKKKKWLLLLLLLLLLFFVVATVVIIVATSPKKSIKIELVIDSDITLTETPELTKEYLPGDQIPAYLYVSLTDEDLSSGAPTDQRVYLRYKISAYVDGNYYPGLFDPLPVQGTEVNYIKGADNYFYHKNTIGIADGEIIIYNYLDFVEEYDNNALNGKTVQLYVEVEILEASQMAIIQEWNTSPNAWREIVE